MPESNKIWFATSNEHKFEEARLILLQLGFTLGRLPAKGTEMQSDDVREIAKRAALERFRLARRPLLVEDTGLFVASLKGFPGPYAAFVNRTIGPAAILSLMKDVQKRDAEFVSAVAFCWRPARVRVFVGKLKGEIAETSRGFNGFGFDPVFLPKGSNRTLAEMSLEEKGAISHRSLALRALGSWLKSDLSRQRLSA